LHLTQLSPFLLQVQVEEVLAATGLLPGIPGKRCAHCNTQTTPLWRNGPDGPKTLCNACGVRDNRRQSKVRAVQLVADSIARPLRLISGGDPPRREASDPTVLLAVAQPR
jgi:Zn ribbon nucleic-acid-binding protein